MQGKPKLALEGGGVRRRQVKQVEATQIGEELEDGLAGEGAAEQEGDRREGPEQSGERARSGVKQADEEEVFAGFNFSALAHFLLRVKMGAIGACCCRRSPDRMT